MNDEENRRRPGLTPSAMLRIIGIAPIQFGGVAQMVRATDS
jgi:hypothetical protein